MSGAVDLSVANSKNLVGPFSGDDCSVINGYYFDYSGFLSEWKSIHDKIFGFNNSINKLKLQVQH